MKLTLLPVINALPTVLWHGMGDHGDSVPMKRFKEMIMSNTDNDYALSLMLGEDAADDRRNGFLKPVWEQISMACEIIANDPKVINFCDSFITHVRY